MDQFSLGVLYVFIFVALSSMKTVYVGWLAQSVHPVVLVFLSFLFVHIWFATRLFLVRESQETSMKHHWVWIFLLNLSTAGSWFSLYLSLKDFEPAVSVALIHGFSPVLTLFLNKFLRKDHAQSTGQFYPSMGLLVILGSLGLATMKGKTGVGSLNVLNSYLGFSYCFLCSVSMVLNNVLSKKLYDRNFQPREVMAIRFPALLILSGSMIALDPALQIPLDLGVLSGLMMIAIFGVTIPLFSLQKGIQCIEPIWVSIMLATIPVVTFLMQFFDSRIHLSLFSFIGVSVTTLLIISSLLLKRQKALGK